MCYIAGIVLIISEQSLWQFAKNDKALSGRLNFGKYCISPPRNLKPFGLFLSFGFYVVPITLVFVMNVVFFALLLRKFRKRKQIGDSTSVSATVANTTNNAVTIRNQQASSTNDTTQNNEYDNVVHGRDENGPEISGGGRNSRYIKPAVTLAVLVGAMAISNLPYCSYLVTIAFCSSCKNPLMVRIWLLVSQLNALLDPLFYSLTQRKIREFYKSRFQRFLR